MSPKHLDEDVYHLTIKGFSGLPFILLCLPWRNEENDYNLGILREILLQAIKHTMTAPEVAEKSVPLLVTFH